MSRQHKPIYVEEHNFLRPHIDFSTLHDNSASITFQIIAKDDCNSETTQWEVEKRFDDRARPNYWGYYVRLFGVDEQGHSVSVYVDGFKPFLYVQMPPWWQTDEMEKALNNGASMAALKHGIKFSRRDVASIEKTWRTQFYGFTNFEQIPVFKINFNNAKSREKFIELCDVDRTWNNYNNLQHSFWLWDACVPPLVQFSNVHNIMASMWVTVSAGSYKFRDCPASRRGVFLKPQERRTRAQLDIDCHVSALTCDTERTDICKFLILCEDIEVAGRPGIFPEPEKAVDPVIQIAATVQRFGDAPNTYLSQCCFCLRETENLRPESVKIYWFDEEAQLLEAYYHYWTDCVDPDMRVAFNQYGFDGPYLYNRYLKLLTHMIPRAVRDGTATYFEKGALDYGKVRNLRSKLDSKYTDSRAQGGNTKHIIEAPGRVEVDVMVFAREEWKMMLGLNALSAVILKNEQKDDIHFSQITPMFNTNAHERGRLAKYCVRDTELPLMILEKKAVIIEQIEKSRLTGVTLHTMFNRKQTVRVETLLFREAHRSEERYSIPQEPFRFIKDPHVLALFRGEHGREGALVLPAQANFYKQPVCTLDFAGLYPSIIRGWGLCYTTLILDPKYLEKTEHRKDVVRNKQLGGKPYDLYWAKLAEGKKPLLYKVLTNILDARAAAKKKQKEFKEGSFDWLIYNGRQLALKVIANAAYGYTVIDHDKCKLPCAAIGVTVTHYGRQMITMTREEVHRRIPGSVCLYGDSVTGDTTLFLLIDGQFCATRFVEVERQFPWPWTPFGWDKESLEMGAADVQVWSDGGFCTVRRFIRHRLSTEKKLFRIVTRTGLVDATDDHSLLLADGTVATASDIFINKSCLLHEPEDASLLLQSGMSGERKELSTDVALAIGWLYGSGRQLYGSTFVNGAGEPKVPDEIMCASNAAIDSFLRGYCEAQGKRVHDAVVVRGKQLCSMIWLLYRRLGCNLFIDVRQEDDPDTFYLTATQVYQPSAVASVVKKMWEIPNNGGFVYDIETESSHFHVAPGNLVVHNTDSVMVKFSEDVSEEAFRKAFPLGKQVAKEITTALFPKEVSLEFEKVYHPYILFQQKNYAGIIFTDPDKPGKVKISGLASVKSDTVGLVARWTDNIVSKMLQERDYHNAKAYLISELIKFVREPVKTEDVAISIKMSKEIDMYAGNNEVATVAAAIAKRDPGRAPGAGHKVSFIHCLDRQCQNKSVPIDVEWYEANRNRFVVDKQRYLRNLMIENVGKLFDLPTVAHDPYQWFLPFERALITAENGGGIARFLKKADDNNASMTLDEPSFDPLATKVAEAAVAGAAVEEQDMEDEGGEEGGGEEEEEFAKPLIASAPVMQEDAEFPMRLFKDTPYAKQSFFKKNRIKKAEEKQLADECRRLSVSIKSVKVSAEKRKLGLPISQFFKTRRIGEEEKK